MIALDHIVLGAATLAQGAAHVRTALGVAPVAGGAHAGMGTHNCLLGLGEGRYLEVIAIDPDAPPPEWPRWFGLDDPAVRAQLAERPRLLSWVVRTDDIVADAARLPVPIAIRGMSRGDLRWQFQFTPDGALMAGGLIPHLIQWDAAAIHPSARLPDSGLRLTGLRGFHPAPETVTTVIQALDLRRLIAVRKSPPLQGVSLQAMIMTPAGSRVLE